MADAPVFDPDRPGPGGAASAAAFVAAMRRLKSWSGLSYRRLERHARAAGDFLPRTTLTTALTHDRLPAEELVAAFARACGCTPAEVEQWIRARRRIAAHEPPPADPANRDSSVAVPEQPEGAWPALAGPPEPSRVADAPTGAHPAVQEARTHVYVPIMLGRSRRRVLLAFALATAMGTAGGLLGVEALKSGAGEPAQAAPASTSSSSGSGAPSPPDVTPVPSAAKPLDSVAAAMTEARPPTERDMRRPPASKPGAQAVLYVGDSIGVETRNAVKYFVHTTGTARVVADVRNGATICDFLSGRNGRAATLSQLVARTKPRVVALQFWSGRAGCAGGKAEASSAAKQITHAAERAGIKRPRLVWVLQGPDKNNRERVRTLNEDVYQAVADDHGDLVADAGAAVSMAAYGYKHFQDGRYKFTGLLPCTLLERRYPEYCMSEAFGGVTHMHAEYEHVHFCYEVTPDHRCWVISPGVVRYSRVIAQTIVKALA